MNLIELLIYFILGVCGILYLFKKTSRGKNYPPGPWGLPMLGHLPMMGDSPYKKAMEWTKTYGPVLAVDFCSFPAVILSDAKLIRKAFNDNDFSGRPDLLAFSAISDGKREGVFLTDGKKWIEQRRFIIRTLRDFGFGKKSMEAIVHEEIKDLIESFKKDIGKPVSTQNRFNAAVLNALWTLIAGERFKQDDPELQIAIKHLTSNIQDNNPRASISNFIPILAKVAPKLSGFENLIKDVFPILNFLKKPIEQHKSTFQTGQPRDLIDVYFEEINKCKDSTSSFYKENGEKSILYSIFDLFAAGAETTSITISWAFLYLAKYPKVQEKLHTEIKKVVGESRLPSLTDRPNMPYTEAVVHEIMRLSSIAPLGAIHSTVKEVELGGYTIPKDTMIMANIYAVHYDEKVWGDPNNFRPERFLNKDGAFVKHDSFIAFSVGKRVCLGETLARDELFLFTVSIFQSFHIASVKSPEELCVEPKLGVLLSPFLHELILTEIEIPDRNLNTGMNPSLDYKCK